MINLKKLGFKKVCSVANRDFYDNGVIKIIEHNGMVYLDKEDGNLCSSVEFYCDKDIVKYMLLLLCKQREEIIKKGKECMRKSQELSDTLKGTTEYIGMLNVMCDNLNGKLR